MQTLPFAEPADRLRTWGRIREFFFREEVPYGLALVRILLCVPLLVVVISRWMWVRELYSTDGVPVQMGEGYGYPNFLPIFSPPVAIALNTALGFFLVCVCVGWCTRVALLGSLLLLYYFGMIDSVSTITKYTVVSSHVLLLLALSPCGAIWSVDAWLRDRRHRRAHPGAAAPEPPRFPMWSQRLIQILIGVTYLGCAITKLRMPIFFSGDALVFWMLLNMNADHPLGRTLTQYPSLLVFSAYVTLVWEVVFLFCAWRGWGRRILLAMGVAFHLLTHLTLGLVVFPMVMGALYFSFFYEEDARWWGRQWQRWRARLGWPLALRAASERHPVRWCPGTAGSLAAFVALCGVTAAVGVAAEHRLDPYGMRRPEGPHQLRELSEEEVVQWLGSEQPLREEDKFFSWDIGKTLVAGRLHRQVHEFRHGDTLICEANLMQPHEDMWIECHLLNGEGRLVSRTGAIAAREAFRTHIRYPLTEGYVPGRYTVVLRSRWIEIARRDFVLRAAN